MTRSHSNYFEYQPTKDLNRLLREYGRAFLNDDLPEAPEGSTNVTWQTDSKGNISAYVTGGGGGGVGPGQVPQIPYYNSENTIAGDPYFQDNAATSNGAGSLDYTGNGSNFSTDLGGSYTWSTDGGSGSESSNFDVSLQDTGHSQSANFNLATSGTGTSSGSINQTASGGAGSNSGNINLSAEGEAASGGNINLSAQGNGGDGAGNVHISAGNTAGNTNSGNVTISASNPANAVNQGSVEIFASGPVEISGNSVNLAGNLAVEVQNISSSPYDIGSALEITDLFDTTSGSIIATLPPATLAGDAEGGLLFILKKIDSSGNVVTITAAGSDTIEGSSTYILSSPLQYVILQSNGTNTWYVVSSKQSSGSGLTFVSSVLAPSSPGNFQVSHSLGKTPTGVIIQMTSGGQIWFQSPTLFDSSNVYLVASDSGLTGFAQVFG